MLEQRLEQLWLAGGGTRPAGDGVALAADFKGAEAEEGGGDAPAQEATHAASAGGAGAGGAGVQLKVEAAAAACVITEARS